MLYGINSAIFHLIKLIETAQPVQNLLYIKQISISVYIKEVYEKNTVRFIIIKYRKLKPIDFMAVACNYLNMHSSNLIFHAYIAYMFVYFGLLTVKQHLTFIIHQSQAIKLQVDKIIIIVMFF